MKDRLILYLSVIVVFLCVNQVAASDLSIGRMRVALWPEYDDQGVLVIYDGRFKNENLFPAETAFIVPKNAMISDACSLSPKGQHFCQLYKQKNVGEIDEVRLKLPYPNFYLSFHINPFKDKKENKNFTYTVRMNHTADKLEVDIQRPLRSEAFKIIPQSTEVSEKKGFEHYGYVFENVSKGKVIDFKIEYIKKDSKPSIDIKYSPMAGPKAWVAPYETPHRFSIILCIAGTLGLLLVIGMSWFVLKRKR